MFTQCDAVAVTTSWQSREYRNILLGRNDVFWAQEWSCSMAQTCLQGCAESQGGLPPVHTNPSLYISEATTSKRTGLTYSRQLQRFQARQKPRKHRGGHSDLTPAVKMNQEVKTTSREAQRSIHSNANSSPQRRSAQRQSWGCTVQVLHYINAVFICNTLGLHSHQQAEGGLEGTQTKQGG